MSLTIFSRYKLVLVRIFKQLVVTICLVSILFSSPAVALASQSIEAHAPKGLTITDRTHNGDIVTATAKNGDIILIKGDGTTVIIKKHDDSNFSLGAIAGAVFGGLSSVSLVSISGAITGLSAAGISTGLATVGGVVGGGMAAGLAVSAALPVAGVVGGLFAVQSINHFLTHHQQENELSISDQKVIVSGKPSDMSGAIY
jgi:ribosomal protein S11